MAVMKYGIHFRSREHFHPEEDKIIIILTVKDLSGQIVLRFSVLQSVQGTELLCFHLKLPISFHTDTTRTLPSEVWKPSRLGISYNNLFSNILVYFYSLLDLRGVVVPDPSDSAERGQYGSVATSQQVRNKPGKIIVVMEGETPRYSETYNS